MSTSTEGWAKAFDFSQDLAVLEQAYQEEHQASLKQTAQPTTKAPDTPSKTATALPSEETATEDRLDTLAVEIATRLGGFLTEPDVVSHYLKLQELQRDNQLMASYIQELLDRVTALEQENRQLRKNALIS